MGMHMNAVWEPAEPDGRTDMPVEGRGMVCRLVVTVPTASDVSLTADGGRIDMTMPLTPAQMTRMGEFLTFQARHASEYLRRCMNPDEPDGIEPGSCIIIPFDMEETGK